MAVSLDRKFFKSISVLGVNFWLHPFRSLARRMRNEDQFEKFNEYFYDDNIAALTPDENEELVSFENCVNCGICPELSITDHGELTRCSLTIFDPRSMQINELARCMCWEIFFKILLISI